MVAKKGKKKAVRKKQCGGLFGLFNDTIKSVPVVGDIYEGVGANKVMNLGTDMFGAVTGMAGNQNSLGQAHPQGRPLMHMQQPMMTQGPMYQPPMHNPYEYQPVPQYRQSLPYCAPARHVQMKPHGRK